MDRIFIGIPILNRLDLLRSCLAAIDCPAQVVVVNNNSVDPQFKAELADLAREQSFTVLHQERNLGVAASWNLIIRTGLEQGHEWIFIGSNDTFLHPGSLGAAVRFPKEADVAVWHLCQANFFLVGKHTIERVGWFDENFYPAYKEDQDYAYRCKLAGMRRIDVPGAGGEHVGSATIRSDPAYLAANQETHFNWNLNHYKMKWGGDAGQERFNCPYNEARRDWRWWPDPMGSIAARDRYQAHRDAARLPAPDLRALYDRAASTPSDIWEHLPILYKYASVVRHVTEFGTSAGNSTSALLFARPDRLITYDVARHPHVADLESAARAAGVDFQFRQSDVRQIGDIEATDLLFIDTWHTRGQMEAELRFAERVGRFILMHDTETFGIAGEPGPGEPAPQGIWPAIADFLRAHPEWEIAQIHRNNNGLTVLRRTTPRT